MLAGRKLASSNEFIEATPQDVSSAIDRFRAQGGRGDVWFIFSPVKVGIE